MAKAKVTHEELAELRYSGEFEQLYPHALGYVALTLGRMMSRGLLVSGQIDDDLRQTANLAAIEACRGWDPIQSQLGSWTEHWIRGELQKYLTGRSTGMIGGRDSGSEYTVLSENDPIKDAEEFDGESTVTATLSYTPKHTHHASHGEEAPEGLGDPMDEAARFQEVELVHGLIAGLRDPCDQQLLRALYGIGRPRMTQAEYATATGVHHETVRRHLADVLRKMRHWV